MNSSVVLSAEHTASLLLIVLGVLLVLVLLAAFVWGSRRASSKRQSPGVDESEPHPTGGSQHGKTWQTLDDDPEQGHPHRPDRDHPGG
ncbi:DUF6479 family protein [Streptomyces sp. NPDC021093]|uniref:DUF6479 family protein n=1 Tax=Streptomyces sp. NPDC021093 TaxID=3365112 RepID=UPI0037A55DD1